MHSYNGCASRTMTGRHGLDEEGYRRATRGGSVQATPRGQAAQTPLLATDRPLQPVDVKAESRVVSIL